MKFSNTNGQEIPEKVITTLSQRKQKTSAKKNVGRDEHVSENANWCIHYAEVSVEVHRGWEK